MFKKLFKAIGDFIYDINDIFITLLIVIVAAGIIIWRASSIMAYPQYLSSKAKPVNNTNVSFEGIDLTPEDVEDINENPEDEGTLVDPDNPPEKIPLDDDDQKDPGTQTDPNQGTQTDPNQGTQTDPNQGTQTDPNQGTKPDPGKDTQTSDIVTIVVSKPNKTATWKGVATFLRANKLIDDTDEAQSEFLKTVSKLKLDSRLQAGTFNLKRGYDYETIIKILCRVKN